jgi:hypothetical protein
MKIKIFYTVVILSSVALLFIASRNSNKFQSDEKQITIKFSHSVHAELVDCKTCQVQ